MTERRKDEKEQGDKKEPAGLLANGLSVHPPVYLPDCDILADEESDQTYGFISKQPLDQTRPVQVLHSSDLCAGFSAPTEKLSLRSASLEHNARERGRGRTCNKYHAILLIKRVKERCNRMIVKFGSW